MATKQEQEEKEEQEFLAKKSKESDEKDTAKKPAKGKEPWRFKLVSGKAHPDNKPPVTVIAEASDESKEKYEASINAEREKLYAVAPDDGAQEESKEDKK